MTSIRNLLAAIVLGATLGLAASRLFPFQPYIPRCQEDAMLIGTGQFEGGAWTAYECGPAVDDYLP